MEDPVTLITVLKVALLLVTAGAAVAIFSEIVPMARGKVSPRAGQGKREE